MKKLFVLLFIAQFVACGAFAKSRTQAEITDAARAAITKLSNRTHAAPRQEQLVELHKTAGFTVMGYENGGFAVVSNDDLLPEVLGVSDACFSGESNPNFSWWLKAINEVCVSVMAKGPSYASGNVPTPSSLGFDPYVDPIVSAEWDQEAPYSNMAPRGRSNQRCLTGCVATAIAQVLYTHKTPVLGSGSRTNFKSYSSYQNPGGSNEDVTFDYDGWTPDYDNMIDLYTSGPNAYSYTEEQANAVAELMLACGVAVNMDYGTDGSGAYTDQAAAGIIQYMGITTADFKERDYFSNEEWMTMVYEELQGGHAMYYSAVDPNPWTGGGHAFVCDGYNEQGQVHINWGWSGKDNGFYNINLLDPGYYEFSQYQDFIRGLWDPNEGSADGIEYVNLTLEDVVAGTLAERIGEDKFVGLRSLIVKGELNNDDIALLNTLASGNELTALGIEEATGHLSNLDLNEAVLEGDEICDNAFKDCAKLSNIRLPRQLVRIGNNAFSGCSKLSNITSYTYSVPKMGTRVFEGVKNSPMKVNLIAGSSEYYRRNAQWKTIITDSNVTEFGTCLKAKNYTRDFGQANPVFGYQMEGERVTGSPRLWTDATVESEPGKYTIYIEAGTIENTKNIVFLNGTLTIKEVTPTTINGVEASHGTTSYNINGVRNIGDTQHGIRIENGRKVISK